MIWFSHRNINPQGFRISITVITCRQDFVSYSQKNTSAFPIPILAIGNAVGWKYFRIRKYFHPTYQIWCHLSEIPRQRQCRSQEQAEIARLPSYLPANMHRTEKPITLSSIQTPLGRDVAPNKNAHKGGRIQPMIQSPPSCMQARGSPDEVQKSPNT